MQNRPEPRPATGVPEKPEYPMRINKYLALKGLATRRSADDLIRKKAVTVNGRVAVLGEKVNADDAVEVRGGAKPANYVYYAYHKPAGMPVSADKKNAKDILQSVQLKGVFPVGALDRDASGLIILTNDRRIIDRLENPKYAHPKRYVITTREPLRANFKDKMEAGISIGGRPTVTPIVKILDPDRFAISIAGNAYSLGSMLALFQNEVKDMVRTGILNIELNKLAPNSHRPISGEELSVFLKSLGL